MQDRAITGAAGARRSAWRLSILATALTLGSGGGLLTSPRRVEAGSITVGTTPKDTAIRDDGTEAYVLSAGSSTLSVISTRTGAVTSTISLGLPSNTCADIDWHPGSSTVVVGCTNGNILTVDPSTGIVTMAASNSACCFDVLCADTTTSGVLAWTIDRNTGRVYDVTSGTLTSHALIGISNPIELVEKKRDPAASSALDVNLYAVGTSGTLARITQFDRSTGLSAASAPLSGVSSVVTGLSTTTGTDAYVTLNVSGAGRLYRVGLSSLAWVTTPVATYGTAALDVATSGQFVMALIQDATLGANLHVYDAADNANILFAGTLPISTTVNPAGGLSCFMGSTGMIDDLYSIYANGAASATAELLSDIRATFVDATPTTVSSGVESQFQATLAGIPDQEALGCKPCEEMQEGGAAGGVNSASPNASSHSAASVQYSTGEEVYRLPIVRIPGVGADVEFELTYRSRREYDYRYGRGWFFSEDARLFQQPSGDERAYDGTGRRDVYALVSGSFQRPFQLDTTMVALSTTTTITDRFGSVTTYDASGKRVSRADRYGNTVSYTWTSDKLTSITDTLGRSYTINYDSTGRLSSIVDFGSRTWSMKYDYMGQLRSLTTPATAQFPSGRTRYFSYSGNHATAALRSDLTGVWNYRGEKVQTLAYDSSDLAVGEDLAGGTYTFSYNALANTRNVVDRGGDTTTWTFDSNAMVTKVERFTKGLRSGEPTSYITDYSIGSNGYPQYLVLPAGDRIDYTYDISLNLTGIRHRSTNTSTTSSSDLVTTMAYGTYNQLTSRTDPLGNTTTVTRDSSGNATAVTRPTVTVPSTQTSSSSMSYDSLGRLTGATDAESRAIAVSYHTSGPTTGYVQTITRDPSGAALATTFDYDSYGNVTRVTDARGKSTELTVDDENCVTEVESSTPFSYRTKLTYDADRNVVLTEVENKDKNGTADPTTPWIQSTATFDTAGRVLTSTRPLTPTTSATSTFSYDGVGRVVLFTSPVGSQMKRVYDERGLLFQRILAFGTGLAATTRFDYDLNGQPVTVTDPRSNSVAYTYDAYGRATRFTNELGNYVTFAYDLASRPTTVEAKDSSNNLLASHTSYYDEVGRRWKVEQLRFGTGLTSSTLTTYFGFDKSDRVTSITDPLSRVSARAYDAVGRPMMATDPAGNYGTYTYDENGNVTKIENTSLPAGGGSETFVTEFGYDALNRRTQRREVDRTNSSNVLVTDYAYDSRGNLGFVVDAEGHPTRYTYDLASRLLSRERALSVGTSVDTFTSKIEELFTYDAAGRLTALVDDNAGATSYSMDARNHVTSVTYPDALSSSYTFDANGNVSTATDQNGTVATNTYDARNRLTGRSNARATGVLGTTAESYSYDALDRVTAAVDDDFQAENTWDSIGNLLKERQGYNSSGNEKWKSVTYDLDSAGALAYIGYPSGFTVGHTRDSVNRLTALVDVGASANIATFLWQGAGRLQKTTNQNGTTTDYAYDGFARVASIDHGLPSAGGSLHKFEYAYDKVHNRRMEKNTFDATWIGTLPSAVQTFLNARAGKGDVYAYDWANRLVDARYDVSNPASEVASPGSQTYAMLVTYALDGLGNRGSVQSTVSPASPVTVTYATDVVNQYTSVGGVSRSHDANGNLKDDGVRLFKFDYQNHIVETRLKSTNALISTYRYDALGRRMEKDVNGGATTRYVLAGQEVVEEYDGSNVWQARYIFEDGIDRPRAMDRADVADVDGDSNTTEVLRFHYAQNALGSVSELSQPTGAVVEWVTYDVYGAAAIRDVGGTSIAQSAVGNPYLFTGREWDVEICLYHYRARAYDPSTGRFCQRDPAGYTSGFSAYEYARSSPQRFTDRMGLAPDDSHPGSPGGPVVSPGDAPSPGDPPKEEPAPAPTLEELDDEITAAENANERAEELLKDANVALRRAKAILDALQNPGRDGDAPPAGDVGATGGPGINGSQGEAVTALEEQVRVLEELVRQTAREASEARQARHRAGEAEISFSGAGATIPSGAPDIPAGPYWHWWLKGGFWWCGMRGPGGTIWGPTKYSTATGIPDDWPLGPLEGPGGAYGGCDPFGHRPPLVPEPGSQPTLPTGPAVPSGPSSPTAPDPGLPPPDHRRLR